MTADILRTLLTGLGGCEKHLVGFTTVAPTRMRGTWFIKAYINCIYKNMPLRFIELAMADTGFIKGLLAHIS